MDLKRLYYYVICLISFFILIWGTVDLASSTISLISLRGGSAPAMDSANLVPDKGDQGFDSFYQSKMLQDRLLDSLSRVMIAGLVFVYARRTADQLEKQS